MGKQRIKPNYRRRVLRLPDLDHCKLAVLNSLGSPASRRVYEYAIDQFIAWYCSEPRLAFNRIVVARYRMHLESRGLAANTINQQLAAVRRLAHEAADSGLLSPELAAGISRVKGVKQLGFRFGNWLSSEQSSEVLKHAYGDTMRARRDYAMLAMLFGCGFRRSELVGLELDEIQMRQGHWAVVDLIGKGGHIRTVPIPQWVKAALDQWIVAARVTEGRIFRRVARAGMTRVQQVMRQTKARLFNGNTQAEDKLVSLFEPQTEIIRKGKAGKPTEFGKLVKIQEAENQVVIAYEVYDQRPNDKDLLVPSVEMHQQRLNRIPTMVAAMPASTPHKEKCRFRTWA